MTLAVLGSAFQREQANYSNNCFSHGGSEHLINFLIVSFAF